MRKCILQPYYWKSNTNSSKHHVFRFCECSYFHTCQTSNHDG